MKAQKNKKYCHPVVDSEVVRKAEAKLQDRIKELSVIYKTSKSITSSSEVQDIINLITDSVFQIIRPTGCLIYLYKSSRNNFILESYKGIRKNSKLEKLITSNKDSLFNQKDVLKNKKPSIVDDVSSLRQTHKSRLEEFNIKSFASMPLLRENKIIGLFVNFSNTSGFFNRDATRVLKMFSTQAAIAIQNVRLLKRTQLSYLDTVKALANIIEAKDATTYGHSGRVMVCALAIANEMKLPNNEKRILRFASFLHDIGKIDIDVSILRKPSSLTLKEWKWIKQHPKIGSEIVKGVGFLEELSPIILNHHARFAGGGYPDPKIKKENIPIGARILAVADAYESMITDRPYRKALSKEQAIKELKNNAGTQFDPKVVNVLLKVLKNKF